MFIALFLSTALAADPAATPTSQTTALQGGALSWYMEQQQKSAEEAKSVIDTQAKQITDLQGQLEACQAPPPAPKPVVHHKKAVKAKKVEAEALVVGHDEESPKTPDEENDSGSFEDLQKIIDDTKFDFDFDEPDPPAETHVEIVPVETVQAPPVDEEREEPTFSPNRAQLGVGELVVIAPPLPSAQAWAADRLEAFGRYEFGVSDKFSVGFQAMAGYGISADATSFRAAPVLAWSLGSTTDFTIGAGPSVLCERAFTAGPLCSVTRTGGFAEMGISVQAAGAVGLEFFAGGGFDAVESVKDGPGAIGNVYGGARLFFGRVGTGETVE